MILQTTLIHYTGFNNIFQFPLTGENKKALGVDSDYRAKTHNTYIITTSGAHETMTTRT